MIQSHLLWTGYLKTCRTFAQPISKFRPACEQQQEDALWITYFKFTSFHS